METANEVSRVSEHVSTLESSQTDLRQLKQQQQQQQQQQYYLSDQIDHRSIDVVVVKENAVALIDHLHHLRDGATR